MEGKKVILLRILQILEKYTDGNHTLTQQKIIDYLKEDFDIDCERKAVSRSLETLRECGYEIVKSRSGICLLSKKYEKSEIRFLIDSVLSSRNIDKKHSEDLIQKLMSEESIYFAGQNHLSDNVNWDKSPNKTVFLTVEILDEAIAKKKKVIFMYNTFDLKKKLIPLWKKPCIISPYFLLFHNQRYYLIGHGEGKKISYYRIDRITDIELTSSKIYPLENLQGSKNIRPEKVNTTFPYLIDGEPEKILLRCNKSIFSDIVDWFGTQFVVTKQEGDYVEIKLLAPPKAMTYWALQYGENVEILEPESLRSAIGSVVKKLSIKYTKKGGK